MNGKGSRPRPANLKLRDQNYSAIQWKSKTRPYSKCRCGRLHDGKLLHPDSGEPICPKCFNRFSIWEFMQPEVSPVHFISEEMSAMIAKAMGLKGK